MKSVGTIIRHAFNYDVEAESIATGLACQDKSKTIQSQTQDSDINEIVRRFGISGQLPQIGRPIIQADFVDVLDYQGALNAIILAQENFNRLPAETRSHFNNDPGLFVDFCSNPENLPELRKLGLADPAPPAGEGRGEPQKEEPVKDGN